MEGSKKKEKEEEKVFHKKQIIAHFYISFFIS